MMDARIPSRGWPTLAVVLGLALAACRPAATAGSDDATARTADDRVASDRAAASPAGAIAPPPTKAATTPDTAYGTTTPSQDGIGRTFMGREIARVMGHQGANWLERAERLEQERPDLLVGLLEIRPGMTVADIGAGTGYHARRMAPLVGDAGRVLAVDVQPQMLRLMQARLDAEGIRNVLPLLGTNTDPALPEGQVDLAIMVDVYHEFDRPLEMLAGIARGLKPDGRLAVIEYRAEDDRVPIRSLHRMTEAQIRRELEAAGYRWLRTDARLPWQHVVFFAPPAR